MKNINWPGWETIDLIGRGSFGAVYEIERKLFDETEKAALKVISIPQNSSDIEEMYNDGYDDESITSTFRSHLQNIVAEYSLMRKMNGSSNIVNCDDVRYIQHDDGCGWDIFIKMELLTPLAKAIPQNPSEETVVRIAKDMCAALELCKKYDIVHRDIKPQNIFVSPNGDYKLGDFGIAKTVEKTMGGTKVGTYKYMAPEVYHNQPYSSGADIYSLGLVLYWLLNERRMPFMPLPPEKMRAGMEEESRYRRMNGEKLPAPKHGSEELKAIVLKACAFDPKDRYQSAAEMKQALEALGKAEEQITETVPVIDMFAEDDATMGAWSPVVKNSPVIEIIPTVEPVLEDDPVMKVDNIEIPTENENKTVGMWAAIEAERERKRKEAEEAERQRKEAERKRLAEETAEKERQRLLEEQRIRDEKAAERKRQKDLEEKKKRDAEEERIRKLAEEKKIRRKKLLPILLVCVAFIAISVGGFLSGDLEENSNNDNLTYYEINDQIAITGYTEEPVGELYIPKTINGRIVIAIERESFANCNNIEYVNIPNSVTMIGEHAFTGCHQLSSAYISNSVSVLESTFYDCVALEYVDMPDSVIKIGNHTFFNCDSLEVITIPESVTQIEKSAFESCDSLLNIIFPSKITVIEESLFYGCKNLKSVWIPDAVKSIGYYSFYGCESLTDVYYSGTKSEWESISIDRGNEVLKNVTIHYNS